MSKRLGSMSLFDVEVYDPATNNEVSFTDLQAAEGQQAAGERHDEGGSGSAAPRAAAPPASVTHTPAGSSGSSLNLAPLNPAPSGDLAAQLQALQAEQEV